MLVGLDTWDPVTAYSDNNGLDVPTAAPTRAGGFIAKGLDGMW
jgi:hypothetical protein